MKRFRSMISLMVILAMCFSFVSFTSCSAIEDLMGGGRRNSRDKDDDEDEDEDEEEEEETEETESSVTETSETGRSPVETEPSETREPVIPVSSSTGNPQVGMEYAYKWDEDTPYSASYYLFSLTEDSKAAYPALDQAFTAFNEQNASNAETTIQSKSLYSRFYMKRADSLFFSGIQTESSDYFSSPSFYGINFNVQTGEILEFSDIIADEAAFCDLMTGRGYPASSFADLEDAGTSFVITNEGITVISPDDDGPDYDCYNLLYNGNEYLFTDAFVPNYGDYICQYGELFDNKDSATIYTDLWADGLLDSLTVNYESDEYGNTTGIYVDIDGNTASVTDIYGYGGYINFLSLEGGYYIFAVLYSDNDYSVTYVFDIGSDSPSLVNEIMGSVTGGPVEVENYYMSDYFPAETVIEACIPTDPHGLYICQRTHLFSSYNVLYPAEFITDAEDDDLNGIFDINGSFGYATGGQILTTLMDVDTISYPDGQSATIPSGTDLKIVLAYGYSNTAIVEDIESGQQYYLTYDNNDYPRTINGVNEEDVLSGIMYAG